MDKQAYREMTFLENFIEFGALHRARVAWGILEQFKHTPEEQANLRASLALDLVQACLNTYEDVTIWLQIMRKWTRGTASITELLDKEYTEHSEDAYGGTLDQLKVLEFGGDAANLARALGVPYRDTDNWELVSEESRERLRGEMDELARLFHIFFWDHHTRRKTGEWSVWRAWNKVKHGIFVTLTVSEKGWGNILTVHTDPGDLSKGYEIHVGDPDLIWLLVRCFVGCVLVGRALNILYQFRFQRIPQVSWLAQAATMNMREINPTDIQGVLTSSHIDRQSLLLGAGPTKWPRYFGQVFGIELSPEWWRPADSSESGDE